MIASCFMDDSEAKLKDHTNYPDRIHCVKLDGKDLLIINLVLVDVVNMSLSL